MQLSTNAEVSVKFDSGLPVIEEVVYPLDICHRGTFVYYGDQQFLAPHGVVGLAEVE